MENDKKSGFTEDLENLQQLPLLRGLDYEFLKLLAMLCKRQNFSSGDQLMVQGEDDGLAFLLLSGDVEAVYSHDGSTSVIQHYSAGQFIGGNGLLGRMVRLFTVQSVTDVSVLQIRREHFQKVVQQFPQSLPKVTSNLLAEMVAWDMDLLKTQDHDRVGGCHV